MITGNLNWQRVASLSGARLKRQVFAIMQQAALSINALEADDPTLLEVVPRLADLITTHDELKGYREVFNALARATGLWNYIDRDTADLADQLVAEAVTIPELGGITLHREQIAALNELFAGKNLILSAPTSFGKSLLIDALLVSGRYARVAIVLPTIALLDEFRRRIHRRLGETFQLIMHPNDQPTKDSVIFLGTQERLIARSDLGKIDLTVVDEFYKLDPNRRDERSVTLNAAVYKLLNRSKQFFFLGPNIDNVRISGDGRWQFEFLRTRFSTVAVDTFDLSAVKNKQDRLFQEIAEDKNWPTLVFVSSPDKANRLAANVAEQMAVSDETEAFANWLSANVGPHWPLVKAVEYGFGVHHGRIPRAIASQMIRMFNAGVLPVLFCTSTLIEGVNTAAKTVLIFDKTIDRNSYDFFTFSNIRGRAGRLGQHHVGKVYLFNEAPQPEVMEISPTLFGNDDEAPDDYVVHLEPRDSSDRVTDRVEALRQTLGLDTEGLRLAATVGLDAALALKQQVNLLLRNGKTLIWSGLPEYSELFVTVNIICAIKQSRTFGARSAAQLTFFIDRLRRSVTMRQFFSSYDATFIGDHTGYDNVFKFLRSCEYGLPQMFALVEAFVKLQHLDVDYSFFIRSLSRWFRYEEIKNLDEEGIPVQIAERFFQEGDDRNALVARLTRAVVTGSFELSEFEREWVSAALDIHDDR